MDLARARRCLVARGSVPSRDLRIHVVGHARVACDSHRHRCLALSRLQERVGLQPLVGGPHGSWWYWSEVTGVGDPGAELDL